MDLEALTKQVNRLKELYESYPMAVPTGCASAVDRATAELTTAADAIAAAVEQQKAADERARQANKALAGLPGYIDLTATLFVEEPPREGVLADAEIVVADDEYDDEYDGEYDGEYDDEPVPAAVLSVNVTAAHSAADVEAAIAEVQESLDAKAPGYTTSEVTDTGAVLTAPDDAGIPEGSLPPGTEVFNGALPHLGMTVSIVIAGDIDPESPPLDPATALAERLAELNPRGEDVPPIEELSIILERKDEAELTIEQAETLVVPVAVNALSSLLGEHTVTGVTGGDTPAQKIVHLRAAGDGKLDRRALDRVAQFDGILPFPGIGKVRAYATT